MPTLILKLNGDGALAGELEGREVVRLTEAPITVAGLEGGMQSGKPSVALAIPLPDGKVVLFETSLAVFLSAADGLRARFGDPRT